MIRCKPCQFVNLLHCNRRGACLGKQRQRPVPVRQYRLLERPGNGEIRIVPAQGRSGEEVCSVAASAGGRREKNRGHELITGDAVAPSRMRNSCRQGCCRKTAIIHRFGMIEWAPLIRAARQALPSVPQILREIHVLPGVRGCLNAILTALASACAPRHFKGMHHENTAYRAGSDDACMPRRTSSAGLRQRARA